jgi:hypothetical protein
MLDTPDEPRQDDADGSDDGQLRTCLQATGQAE